MRAALFLGVVVSGVLLTGCGGSTPGGSRGLGDTASPATSSSAAAEPTEQAESTPDSAPSVQPSASDAAPLQANKVAGANGGASCPHWDDFVAQLSESGDVALTCGEDEGMVKRYHYLGQSGRGGLLLYDYGPLIRWTGVFYLESNRPCSARQRYQGYIRDLPWMQGYC